MSWEVIMDEEFEDWINALDRTERTRIMMHVGLLQELGPNLGWTLTVQTQVLVGT